MTVSDNENVRERTPERPVALTALGEQLLAEANSAGDGRSALTLTPSGGGAKQTLVAVRAGQTFGPQHWNGPTSLQVLRGAASVDGTGERLTGGSWTMIEHDDARVTADEDLVALLTVGAPS